MVLGASSVTKLFIEAFSKFLELPWRLACLVTCFTMLHNDKGLLKISMCDFVSLFQKL